jgi:peptide/nickel transport system ATP-binding protein
MAHRVALMYAGQIVEVAPAERFFTAPRHPYAQALLRALPSAGRRSGTLEAIPGTVPSLDRSFVGCRFAPRCAMSEGTLPGRGCAIGRPERRTPGALRTAG